MLNFFPWMFLPGRRSFNVLTRLFLFITAFSTHIPQGNTWILSTHTVSSQLTPSSAEATTSLERLFGIGSSKLNGSYASNQDKNFIGFRLSRSILILQSSSLVCSNKLVKSLAALSTLAHRCIVLIQVTRTDSVILRPFVISPLLFSDLISTCFIVRPFHTPPQNLSIRRAVWNQMRWNCSYTHG